MSRTFDEDGNPSHIITAGVTNNYTIDNASRITGISDSGLASNSWTFGYDLFDRINSGTSTALTRGYTYDANSNRLTTTGTSASVETTAAASNQLNSTTGSIARTYGYDTAGNVTSFSGEAFSFGQRGRMTSATSNAGKTNYFYNALGQLIEKTGNGGTTLLMYDEAGHVLGEYTATGTLIQETIWMGETPVATLRPNGSTGCTSTVCVFYVHTNHLGTPRKITRPSDNALMWRWDPDTFGTTVPNNNPAGLGAFIYNPRFPGQYFLSESGLYYNYFRDYDLQMGRYIESDPIGLHSVPNTYAYVSNSPTGNVDPLGLEPVPIGQGYMARVDQFNFAGKSSFEIHVFNAEGDEIGVYGPQGWIAKHGFAGRPAGLPAEIENTCKGIAVERLRASGDIPPRGRFNIKGNKWMRLLKWLPFIGIYQEETRPSVERACELDPGFAGC